MFYLKCLLGASTTEAAQMVAAKRKADLNGKRRDLSLDRVLYTAKTLAQHYSRRWKKEFDLDEENIESPLHPARIKQWSYNDKKQFLAIFPEESIPRSIRLALLRARPASHR
jgi:hypothetical protein